MNILQDESIISLLERKIGRPECPMCHHKEFVLANGYMVNILQDEPFGSIKISGRGIPSVALICTHCGFISNHAIGMLGIKLDREGDLLSNRSLENDGEAKKD